MAQSGEKWGINMLSGEYRHNIDLKGRIIIPSKIRFEMGDKIVITRGLDGCLFGYKTCKNEKGPQSGTFPKESFKEE